MIAPAGRAWAVHAIAPAGRAWAVHAGEPGCADSLATAAGTIRWSVTGDNPLGPAETELPDAPTVREELASANRDDVAALVQRHPESPLAWAELSDIAHADGRVLDAYAFAVVAHARGMEALERAGWRPGDAVPWQARSNRGVLRAAYALRRAASAIGAHDEADRLGDFLQGVDPTAVGRIEVKYTTTQLLPVITPEMIAAASPPTEAFVIRGED